MRNGRLEAFSDGVLAIVITIMVLELDVPEDGSIGALAETLPTFLAYVLSFAYVGIHWNNHHHLLGVATGSDAGVMWANLHLLFWLSLIPFTSGWIGRTGLAPAPTALYGVVLLMAGIAYAVLQRRVMHAVKDDEALVHEIGDDRKGRLSLVAYALAIGLAYVLPILSCAIYAAVALFWAVPDRRLERAAREAKDPERTAPEAEDGDTS